MLKISGIFKSCGVEARGKGKLLSLANRDKDRDGNFSYTYYHLWINDKISKMIDDALKKKIAEKKAILDITGFLKVQKVGNFTNLTIIPETITEYSKNNEVNFF
jgi:hypothetical protein